MKKFRIAKKNYNAVKDMPKLEPEPEYIIKTRPPMWDDWRLNIFRGIKENRLKMDANKIARRKCWQSGLQYENCCKDGGMFGHMKCKKVYSDFLSCCYHEREVELDKMRRDISLHKEWYWLNIYDENGEIGKQELWKPEESMTGMWKKMGYNMFYGDSANIGNNKEEREIKKQKLESLRKS